MWLILDDKNNICRYGVGWLVTLSRKCDFGALFPPTFYIYGEYLVLSPQGASIRIEAFPWDFHTFGAPVKHFLQRNPQLMMDCWVLLASGLPTKAHMPITRKTVEVEAWEWAESVPTIHLHVIIISPVDFPPKEYLKRVGTSKKCCKGSVGIPMEGVGEVGSLAICGSSSTFKTCTKNETDKNTTNGTKKLTTAVLDILW